MTNPNSVAVLRECPFCGGPANMDGESGSWGYYPATAFVRCSKCSTRGPTFHDDEGGKRNYRAEAAAAWNRRAALSAQGDAVATVEAWSHGETYLHWHTSAMNFPAGAKLCLHPAPPGSDAVTEERAIVEYVMFGYRLRASKVIEQDARRVASDYARKRTAALAARTGKGEANGR